MDIAGDLAPTGALRASINLGNPVLAQGTSDDPSGITVDIAREVGARLDIPVELHCFDAARDSLAALNDGRADICFLAIDPARAETVAFTAPYAVIEGVFVVNDDSAFTTSADVDQPGIRVGVKQGSAYDLFLTRTLTRASIVRGVEGTVVFSEQQLEVAAGIRAPMVEFVAGNPGLRVLEPRFMEIEQAVGTTRSRHGDTIAYLCDVIEDLKSNGFVAAALERAGRKDATVAPPA